MSGLSIISPKEMLRVLTKLGFSEIRQNGSHKFFHHEDGRCTVIPMHNKDLKRGLIKGILKDIAITDDQYEDLKRKI